MTSQNLEKALYCQATQRMKINLVVQRALKEIIVKVIMMSKLSQEDKAHES